MVIDRHIAGDIPKPMLAAAFSRRVQIGNVEHFVELQAELFLRAQAVPKARVIIKRLPVGRYACRLDALRRDDVPKIQHDRRQPRFPP